MPEKADAVSEDGRPSGLARTPRKVGHPQTSTADPVSLRCGEGTGSRFRRKDGQACGRDCKRERPPEVEGSVALQNLPIEPTRTAGFAYARMAALGEGYLHTRLTATGRSAPAVFADRRFCRRAISI